MCFYFHFTEKETEIQRGEVLGNLATRAETSPQAASPGMWSKKGKDWMERPRAHCNPQAYPMQEPGSESWWRHHTGSSSVGPARPPPPSFWRMEPGCTGH
jgi:hypothetical protein